MSNFHKHSHLLLNCLGTVGSIVSGYISEYMTEEDIKKINSKIKKLNDKLKNLCSLLTDRIYNIPYFDLGNIKTFC